jgi:hypothetical protein
MVPSFLQHPFPPVRPRQRADQRFVRPYLCPLVVPLMTYVVMPRMTRLFKSWLYPSATP